MKQTIKIKQINVQTGEETEIEETIEINEEEIAKYELQIKINEAKQFLDKSDKKVLPYYEFEDNDNDLEWYIEERSKARKFIRDNQWLN